MKTQPHRSAFASLASRPPTPAGTFQVLVDGSEDGGIITAKTDKLAKHKAQIAHPGRYVEAVRVW